MGLKRSASQEGQISRRAIIGYGAGDFGLNLFYTGLNLYLLFYYTDVAGLNPALAGGIFMVSLLWDAVTDPLMGLIASRTNTRFGRYRPYILFASPLLGASFVLMFAAPVFWPAHAALACLVTHLLFRTIYTIVGVPIAALSAAMTTSGRTRASLAGARMQFATLGAIVTAFLTPLLAGSLGGEDLALGYMLTAILYALVAEVVLLIAFASVREHVEIDAESPDLGATLKVLKANTAFWILFAVVVTNTIASTIFTKSIVYYARYVIGEPGAVREALTLYTLAAAAAILAWTQLARLRSKAFTLFCGLAINTIAYLLLYLTGPDGKLAFYALTMLSGIGTSACIVAFWSMLPDTVEYGQWKTGVRDEGIVFGLFQFSQKASSGLGIGAVGLLLSAIGYAANLDQSDDTLHGLRTISFLLPALGAALATLIVRFYPLSAERHAAIVRELEGKTQK
ncbi:MULTISPECIES: MFS transporter [Hyphomonas]|jgi:GPH family glycoside/pentoside/hexuronide:cation symporter|uniref:MFS transporter n=2 Tax=Hyphomonadaceae TaxID=69657 RepID=UPI0035192092